MLIERFGQRWVLVLMRMEGNMKWYRKVGCSTCCVAMLACLMAPGPMGDPGPTANVWGITDPVDEDKFSAAITSLGAAGTAENPDVGYTVKVSQLINNVWTVVSSAGGTSTSSTSNSTWGCTLTAPTGGFNVESAKVKLRHVGAQEDDDETVIFFEE